jgi:hypothetical protein
MNRAPLFIVLLILNVSSQSSYFQNASISNIILDSSYTVVYATKIDTIHYDSVLVCALDTCYWDYQNKLDTVATSSTKYYVWVMDIQFTLFDSHNDSFSISKPAIYWTYCSMRGGCQTNYFEVDTIWGDVITKPGTNKHLIVKFTSFSTYVGAINLFATNLANQGSITYSFSASTSLPTSIINKSINVHRQQSINLRKACYSINGRLIKGKTSSNSVLINGNGHIVTKVH